MKKLFSKLNILIIFLIFLFGFSIVNAVTNTVAQVPYGGTGVNTITGIPYGTGTAPLSIVTVGSGLSFTGGTLSSTVTGTVTSVSGTSNRITSTGGTTPVIDISGSYVGQSSITTLGTVGTGTWQGTKIGTVYGGTNLDSSASTGVAQVSSGTWSVSTALANGTTATTQSAGDNSTKVATTAYTDGAVATGISQVNAGDSVSYTTAAILPNSPIYNNGASGVGATITTLTTNTALVVDGQTPTIGMEILVKNEGDSSGLGVSRNGIYVLTTPASLGVAWVLTRATDYDTASEINGVGLIYTMGGTANVGISYALVARIATVGVDSITYQVGAPKASTIITTSTSAGGDLTGTYPNPTIAKIQGTVVSSTTGSTNVVFSNSPTLVTPTLGAASGTSLTLSAPGTSSTSVPSLTSTNTFTNKRNTKRVSTVTQSATPTWNTDNGDIFEITGLAQAITSMTTNLSGTPVDGDLAMVQITDNGTARGITWGASFESTANGTLPNTTVISTMLRILLQWNGTASKWDCLAVD